MFSTTVSTEVITQQLRSVDWLSVLIIKVEILGLIS